MKKMLLALAASVVLVACNGGNGDGASTGTRSYSHNELAVKFVQELNLDAEFNVTLVKKDTEQYNYIVIYDPLYDAYDAINIGSYNPAYDNAVDYYNNNSYSQYYDLIKIAGHYETVYDWTILYYDEWGDAVYGYDYYDVWVETVYEDYYTGIVFEKVEATKKDLAKVAALKEVATLKKSAQFLSSEMGLSIERSTEVAKLVQNWKKSSKKGMTDAELDSFSTELLGFSISAGKDAALEAASGDAASLDSLVEQAALTNGITPEHADKLMTKMFGL